MSKRRTEGTEQVERNEIASTNEKKRQREKEKENERARESALNRIEKKGT